MSDWDDIDEAYAKVVIDNDRLIADNARLREENESMAAVLTQISEWFGLVTTYLTHQP